MDDAVAARRRRGVGLVTPNACTECRKKRAKCDGATPCQRCITQGAECIYEVPVRQSKETMRTEIEQLNNHRRQSERVLAALSAGNLVSETLNRLRNGQNLEAVSEWLESEATQSLSLADQPTTNFSSPSYHDALDGTLRMAESVTSSTSQGPWPSWHSNSNSERSASVSHAPPSSHNHGDEKMEWVLDGQSRNASENSTYPLAIANASSPTTSETARARGRGQEFILGSDVNMDEHSESAQKVQHWTAVTQNDAVIDHFMALYFCWEYPTFASLSKEHFMADYRAGRPRYCSSLLVNAMLCLGCRFSSIPESRSDANNSETSGDHFYAEARKLLAMDDMKSLTTIQALCLLSIRDASCGKDTDSYFYAGEAIRLAAEFGLHLNSSKTKSNVGDTEHEVRAATFWGAFALDEAWNLCMGRIPHFSRSAQFIEKPLIHPEIESSEWVPYTDDGTPLQKSANQPSNVQSVFRCFAGLSEIVHCTSYTLHTPGKRLTSNEIVSMYYRYINWYSALPEALRLGHNFTPSVLFVHMYYHFAMVLLLRPFIKLRCIGSSLSPREVCIQAADNVIILLRSYDQLYTLARTPSFVPYIAMTVTITHLAVMAQFEFSSPSLSPSISLPHNHTQAFATSYHHNKLAVQIHEGVAYIKTLRSCHGFAQRGLDIVRFFAQHWHLTTPIEDDTPPSLDGLAESCRPANVSLNMFCPTFGAAMPDKGPMSASSLFGPFPMQGLPLIAADAELEADGFERLDGTGE